MNKYVKGMLEFVFILILVGGGLMWWQYPIGWEQVPKFESVTFDAFDAKFFTGLGFVLLVGYLWFSLKKKPKGGNVVKNMKKSLVRQKVNKPRKVRILRILAWGMGLVVLPSVGVYYTLGIEPLADVFGNWIRPIKWSAIFITMGGFFTLLWVITNTIRSAVSNNLSGKQQKDEERKAITPPSYDPHFVESVARTPESIFNIARELPDQLLIVLQGLIEMHPDVIPLIQEKTRGVLDIRQRRAFNHALAEAFLASDLMDDSQVRLLTKLLDQQSSCGNGGMSPVHEKGEDPEVPPPIPYSPTVTSH